MGIPRVASMSATLEGDMHLIRSGQADSQLASSRAGLAAGCWLYAARNIRTQKRSGESDGKSPISCSSSGRGTCTDDCDFFF